MSTSEIASILDNSKELDRLRKEQEDVLSDINKLHKKLLTNPEVVEKPGDTSLSKLKNFYTQAKDLAETEVRVSNILLTQLDSLLPPGQQRRRVEGNEQKKKQKRTDSDISRVSPSPRNQYDNPASLKGEQVAAKVRVTTEDSVKEEYIVVKVIDYDRETKEFEVIDEEPSEEDEGGGPRQYKVPVSHIIPFPKRNDPSTALDFPPGRTVLAVYPTTTALYKATVVNPSRKRKTDDYLLEFDDDESEDGTMPKRSVPFYNVVALPEGRLKKWNMSINC